MKPSLVSSKPNRYLIFIGHSIVPLLLPRPPLPSTTLPTSTLPLRPRLPSTVPHLSCYCPTPLEHERATVYDHFFSQLETSVIDNYQDFPGRPFMVFLQDEAS